MNLFKGFSFIEVLLSLILATSLVIVLFNLQSYNRFLFHQSIIRQEAARWLDQANEAFVIDSAAIPQLPSPYALSIKNHLKETVIHIDWLNEKSLIRRSLSYRVG